MQKIDVSKELDAFIPPHIARVMQIARAGRYSVSFVGPSDSGKSFYITKLIKFYKNEYSEKIPMCAEFRYCECGNMESPRICRCSVESVRKYVSEHIRLFRSCDLLVECSYPRTRDFMDFQFGRKTNLELFVFDDKEIAKRDSMVIDKPACLDLLWAACRERNFDWKDFNTVVSISKTLAMMSGRWMVEPQDIAEAAIFRMVELTK